MHSKQIRWCRVRRRWWMGWEGLNISSPHGETWKGRYGTDGFCHPLSYNWDALFFSKENARTSLDKHRIGSDPQTSA